MTSTCCLRDQKTLIRSWACAPPATQSKNLRSVAKTRVFELRNDPSPQVRLQVAIAAAKQESIPTIPTLVAVLAQAGDDPLVPRIVWQNLHPLLEKQTAEFRGGSSEAASCRLRHISKAGHRSCCLVRPIGFFPPASRILSPSRNSSSCCSARKPPMIGRSLPAVADGSHSIGRNHGRLAESAFGRNWKASLVGSGDEEQRLATFNAVRR
jgi:hypothetical protein